MADTLLSSLYISLHVNFAEKKKLKFYHLVYFVMTSDLSIISMSNSALVGDALK